MADSKYSGSENCYSTTSTKHAGVQRSRYSNPNVTLPPNSTMNSMRSHLLHKSQPMAATSQIPLLGTGNVSGF